MAVLFSAVRLDRVDANGGEKSPTAKAEHEPKQTAEAASRVDRKGRQKRRLTAFTEASGCRNGARACATGGEFRWADLISYIEWISRIVRNPFISTLQIEPIKITNAGLLFPPSQKSWNCRSRLYVEPCRTFARPDCWKQNSATESTEARAACSIL